MVIPGTSNAARAQAKHNTKDAMEKHIFVARFIRVRA